MACSARSSPANSSGTLPLRVRVYDWRGDVMGPPRVLYVGTGRTDYARPCSARGVRAANEG